MNFYGVRELSNNTKSVLVAVSKEGSAVITDNGKPTAIMLSISEATFESVLAMVQRFKAKQAFESMQKQARTDFPNGMTEEEIEEEIAAARRGESCSS